MTWLLGLLPDQLQWAPHLLGGGGIVAAIIGFVPKLRTYALFGLAALLALSVVGLLWYRGQYEAAVAACAKERLAAAQAVVEQYEKDRALSASLIARQAEQLATLSARASTIQKGIDNAPKTNGCGPVMRDTSRGLHELFGGAGSAPARRQPAATMPGSGAGARP